MRPAVSFTRTCPDCGADALWTATLVLLSTGRIGANAYGPTVEGVRYTDACPCRAEVVEAVAA